MCFESVRVCSRRSEPWGGHSRKGQQTFTSSQKSSDPTEMFQTCPNTCPTLTLSPSSLSLSQGSRLLCHHCGVVLVSCGVLFLLSQASLIPQLPNLGLGTLLLSNESQPGPCCSVVPEVCLVSWGSSLPFSPLASSFPLCSPFLVNPRVAVCSRGLFSGAGSLQCPYKGLWGRSKVCHSVSVTVASSSCTGKDTEERGAQIIPWRCLPASQCHRH